MWDGTWQGEAWGTQRRQARIELAWATWWRGTRHQTTECKGSGQASGGVEGEKGQQEDGCKLGIDRGRSPRLQRDNLGVNTTHDERLGLAAEVLSTTNSVLARDVGRLGRMEGRKEARCWWRCGTNRQAEGERDGKSGRHHLTRRRPVGKSAHKTVA